AVASASLGRLGIPHAGIALFRSLACLLCLDLAVAGRGIGLERIEQPAGGLLHVVDGTVEGHFVRLGRMREAAQLANELQRRSANLVLRCRWLEVEQGANVSAHGSAPAFDV